MTSSPAKLAANRQNAQVSTGPRTPEGKAASAANARRHGLAGAFTVLAHEDQEEFQALLDQYRAEFKPASAHEQFLVEEMAQSRWTLARARRIQAHVLNRLAGAEPETGSADARLAACLVAKAANPIAAAERYVTTADRAYFRAHRELTQGRSREKRDKANDAQVWLKEGIERVRASRAQYSEPEPTLPYSLPATPEMSDMPHPPAFCASAQYAPLAADAS